MLKRSLSRLRAGIAAPFQTRPDDQLGLTAPALETPEQGPEAHMHFDGQHNGDIHGWAAFTGADRRADIVLSMGGAVLGRIARTQARPDVDAIHGSPEQLKGFGAPLCAPILLAQMVGSLGLRPTVEFAELRFDLMDLDDRLADLSLFRSLRLAYDDAVVQLTDLWFSGTHRLHLRLEHPRTDQEISLRFYQPRSGRAGLGGMELVGESSFRPSKLQVIDVDLASPYLPVLICVLDHEDALLHDNLLPFPSLARGGQHAAEQLALGGAGDYVADLRALSDALVRELVGWPDADPRALGSIAVETLGATGAERLFAPGMTEWLRLVFGFTVRPISGGPKEARRDLTHVGQEIARRLQVAGAASGEPAEAAPDGLTLTLPPDAIPTISALASRRLSAGPIETAAPFLAADEAGRETYLVTLPSREGALTELQPITRATGYPVLRRSGEAGHPKPSPPVTPVAITLRAARGLDDERRLYPIPLDHRGPLLRGAGAGDGSRFAPSGGLTIVVSVRNEVEDATAFLCSVASQTIADDLEVVVVDNRSLPDAKARIRGVLEEYFAGRHHVIAYDRMANAGAQRNLGAEAATKAQLLFATPDMFLHDPRTLAVLSEIAARDDVASASCLILHATPSGKPAYGFRSAGFFPGSINFGGAPHVSLTEPDPELALPLATYPVFANAFSLTAVRADVWREVGGCDPGQLPGAGVDIDYCIRALRAGFRHICTTGITAFQAGQRRRANLVDVPWPGLGATLEIAALMSSSATFLRRL